MPFDCLRYSRFFLFFGRLLVYATSYCRRVWSTMGTYKSRGQGEKRSEKEEGRGEREKMKRNLLLIFLFFFVSFTFAASPTITSFPTDYLGNDAGTYPLTFTTCMFLLFSLPSFLHLFHVFVALLMLFLCSYIVEQWPLLRERALWLRGSRPE